MSFNIFGPATKDDIRVGYISTDRGFVDGVSVCDANEYAAKNPGTTFIFRTRDITRYLNINEVNRLTPDDLSATKQGCDGIQLETECGPAQVYFYGGGGVGVQGNPIIGVDGSLLAVDLVYGGNGYQYPPIVEVKDGCGIGAGAVTRAILGEVIETVEVYDQEADFEEYELCEQNISNYGQKFNPDGSVVGVWDPTLYANLSEDPIRREIRDYQEFLQELSKPWWTTRKEAPLKITSPDGVNRTKVDVTDETYREARGDSLQATIEQGYVWNAFMNKYAISPVPPSNVIGSDFGPFLFTFEWEEDFPYDGEYTFRGCADGAIKDLYLDDQKLTTLASYNESPVKIKKNIKSGVHKIKIELENGSFTETVTETITEPGPPGQSDVNFKITTAAQYGNGLEIKGLFKVKKDFNGAQLNENISQKVERGKEYEVIFTSPESKSGIRLRTQGQSVVQMEEAGDNDWSDLVISCSEGRFYNINGSRCKFIIDNVIKRQVSKQVLKPVSWNDNPMGVSVTIDAPLPPIPVEPIPEQQEGRCPNNPIWTTRFPTAENRWWPVSYSSAMKDAGVTKWSEFLDRYAVSPVPPLIDRGSDGSGVLHLNSWPIDIPYDGFYRFAVQRDETARIYVDGSLAFDVKTAGDMLWKNYRNKPKFQTVFFTKGSHTISIELEQRKTDTFELIDKKVFSTKDWLSPPVPPKQEQKQSEIQTEEWVKVDDVFVPPTYQSLGGGGIFGPAGDVVGPNASFHRYDEGTYYSGKKIRQGGDWNDTNPYTNYIEWDKDTRLTLGTYYPGSGSRFGISVWQKRIVTQNVVSSQPTSPPESVTNNKNGVTYSGPPLANYLYDFLSPQFADPFTPPAEEIQGKTWVMTWSNVDFFEDGQYTITAKVDDSLVLKIDGQEITTVKLAEGYRTFYYNTFKSKKSVQVEVSNLRFPETSFQQNPTYFSLEITKQVNVSTGLTKSWVENPIGISAILIPPPCPKIIRGKGVVTDVIVDDPGNGYPVPQNDVSPDVTTTYPASLRLKSVEVEDPGINYNCGIDQIQITPDNGAVLDYECDTFGRITSVKVLNPGLGFTRYPDIRMVTPAGPAGAGPAGAVPTGVNATFRPQFEVVRDPIVVDEDKLIQVTDLVGLKQTGYVDGRAYYGAVFYKEGVRYAGFYETPGQLVQVYNTLQESIDAEITTPPSAIQRQGTDVTSNDPRLNIPNTPDDLIQG